MVSSSHPSGISPAHTLTSSLSQTWPHVFPAVSIRILPRKETAISKGFFKRHWMKRSKSEHGGYWSPTQRERYPATSHSGKLVPGLHLKQWAEVMRAPWHSAETSASWTQSRSETSEKKAPRMRKQTVPTHCLYLHPFSPGILSAHLPRLIHQNPIHL